MNLSKRTAERMLQNINKQLESLATEQQSMNGNKGGQKMGKGGRVKMATRGSVPYYLDRNTKGYSPVDQADPLGKLTYPFQNGDQGFTPYMLGNVGVSANRTQPGAVAPTVNQAGSPVAVSDANLAKVAATPTTGQPTWGGNIGGMNQHLNSLMPNFGTKAPNTLVGQSGVNDVQLPTAGGGFDYNNLMGLAPSIFNTIAGLTSGRADNINANQYQNPYESQAFSMMPDQFRIDDILNDNRNAYGTYLRNVNQTGNSRGERMANYGAGMNRMNEANTRAWALKNNQENEMRTNKAEMRNNQGVRRAGINLQVRDMNDQNKGATRNRRMDYLGAAASGAQTYGLTQQQMANQSASQDAYINALKKMNPYMAQWLGLNELNRG